MRKFRGLPVLKYARYVSKSVALPWTSKKISKLIYHIWHPLYLHPVILKNSRARYPSVQFSKGKKCQISQSAAFLISRHSFRFLSDSWYIPTYLVMSRALRDQASANPEPWKLSSSWTWALKSLCLLKKLSWILGRAWHGPFSKFWARALKMDGPGLGPITMYNIYMCVSAYATLFLIYMSFIKRL